MTTCPHVSAAKGQGQSIATASAPPPPPAPVPRREQSRLRKVFIYNPDQTSPTSARIHHLLLARYISPLLNYAKISLSCLPLITLQKAPSYYLNHVTDGVMCGLMPGCTAGVVFSPSTTVLPTWSPRVFSEARGAHLARVRWLAGQRWWWGRPEATLTQRAHRRQQIHDWGSCPEAGSHSSRGSGQKDRTLVENGCLACEDPAVLPFLSSLPPSPCFTVLLVSPSEYY